MRLRVDCSAIDRSRRGMWRRHSVAVHRTFDRSIYLPLINVLIDVNASNDI